MKFKESMFVYLAFLACVFVFYSRSIEHTIRYGKNLKLMRTVCKSLMAEADEGQRMYGECTAASTSSITPDEIGAVVLDHSNNIVLKRNCTFDDEDILNYMQNSEVPLRKLVFEDLADVDDAMRTMAIYKDRMHDRMQCMCFMQV